MISLNDDFIQILKFSYTKSGCSDKAPRILLVHLFENPKNGKITFVGVNLNYLNRQDKDLLFGNVKELLDLYPPDRYEFIYNKVKSSYVKGYRHYDESYMEDIEETMFRIDTGHNPF